MPLRRFKKTVKSKKLVFHFTYKLPLIPCRFMKQLCPHLGLGFVVELVLGWKNAVTT